MKAPVRQRVFTGIRRTEDGSDDSAQCKKELAPDGIRNKYKGKKLSEEYRYGLDPLNPVRFSLDINRKSGKG